MKRNKPLSRKTPLKKSLRCLRSKSSLSRGTKGLKKSKLSQVSAKRKVDGARYSELRKAFLSERPLCEVCIWRRGLIPGSKVEPATEVHHKAGRGKFYLRVDTWLATCHHDHETITSNRGWAEARGFSLTVEQRRKL